MGGLQWAEAGGLQELTACGWCAPEEVEPSLSSQDEWEDRKEKLLALLRKGELWKTGMDETAQNSFPFLKQQKRLSALCYINTEFSLRFERISNLMKVYFPTESSSNSAAVSWEKKKANLKLRGTFFPLLEIDIMSKFIAH